MPWSPEQIPIWLRRTPEQLAQDRALQDRLRSARGPGRHPNPTERRLLRGQALERLATAALRHLILEAQNPKPEHIEHAKAQLADAWAMMGRYEDAAALQPDPVWKARYAAIATALEHPEEHCDDALTERVKDPISGRMLTIQNRNVDEIVISQQHGNKLMPLIRCTKCGRLTVAPAPPALAKRLKELRTKEE